MQDPENPFILRASEQIENDSVFLRLFSDSFLDILSPENFLSKVHVFISAPGGGKTTLFRIFTPESILQIHTHRKNPPHSELFKKLKNYNIVTDEKPLLLGIYLLCTNSFADIDNLELKPEIKNKLFLSLLASRIIISSLRGILNLARSDIDSLSKIRFRTVPSNIVEGKIDSHINGEELYEKVSNIELKISKILDSLNNDYDLNFTTFRNFDFLKILSPKNILYDGKPIIEKTLFMFDDIHILKKSQIFDLFKNLECSRPPISIWLSERKEALQFDELINGNTDRDFQFIKIEDELGENYKNIVKKIADLRGVSSKLRTPFTECVNGSLDSEEWNAKFEKIIQRVKQRIASMTKGSTKYNQWINEQKNKTNSNRTSAIEWRALEILIQRKEKGGQTQLDNNPLPFDETKKISEYKSASELFISYENKEIPYYCNFEKIISLSTCNIEQFLFICSDLFDESLSNSIRKKGFTVSLSKQQAIIKETAKNYWNRLPKNIPYGENAFWLLDSFAKKAHEQTYRKTAPYLPGITGFGIHHEKYLEIINKNNQKKFPIFKTLEGTLRSCLAHNVLTVKTTKQGPKNSDPTIVFYLNRLLCVSFNLPLGYGGFKPTTSGELSRWIKPSSKGLGE